MIDPHTIKYISGQINEDTIFQDKKRRSEMIRIMIQTMHNLGLVQSAETLQKESSINLDSDILHGFKQSILNAEWNKALEYLEKTNADKESFFKAQQLIIQQKYIELLEQKDIENALKVLREELSYLINDQQYLFKLSSLLICRNSKEMYEKIGFNRSQSNSRSSLIELIQDQCNIPGLMQSRVMEKLVKESLIFQTLQCPCHIQNSHESICLVQDHVCRQLQSPQELVETKKEHKSEVTLIKFNRQGSMLVSVGLEREIFIWKYDPKSHKLTYHQKIPQEKSRQLQVEITSIEFDNTDQYLAIGYDDGKIIIYNTVKFDQQQITNMSQIYHQAPVLTLAYHPQTNSLYSAGADPYMLVFSNNGKELEKKIPSTKTKDMKFINKGNQLVQLSACKPVVSIFDLASEQVLYQIQEEECILSMNVSFNEKFLLVNTSQKEPELHLWDLELREQVNTYKGHQQREFQLGCTFGGNDDMFVVQGCETGNIFIWQTFNSKFITQIKAHLLNKAVNQVIFHPIDKTTMISCSDDQTIKVWTSEIITQQQNQQTAEIYSIHEEDEDVTITGIRQPGARLDADDNEDMDQVEFNLRNPSDNGEEDEEEEDDDNQVEDDDDVDDEEDIYEDDQHNSQMEEEEEEDEEEEDEGHEDFDVDEGTEEIDDECSQYENQQNPQP
ncbi:WD domain, G-beta repeat protein (macronuclear) [Tetrahymena thermophila SB210]|uniref:WD domain, G-beta repeat protein n=1 Tax=Tetrahymena thermophila (strain SB210) TaxID=312017 RepID=Q23YU9_TETTS|nr:WD domain, G-beta repeat protein [Tetrahymena thermophila SB210]EAS01706.3 WD domain, G-beta repeat protein [Tetrahymena thermophila SB210]|eukprot:XP_001021951.3 WD domain, G-beta repeat protein [Tetrahymena thermophila SB210]